MYRSIPLRSTALCLDVNFTDCLSAGSIGGVVNCYAQNGQFLTHVADDRTCRYCPQSGTTKEGKY